MTNSYAFDYGHEKTVQNTSVIECNNFDIESMIKNFYIPNVNPNYDIYIGNGETIKNEPGKSQLWLPLSYNNLDAKKVTENFYIDKTKMFLLYETGVDAMVGVYNKAFESKDFTLCDGIK